MNNKSLKLNVKLNYLLRYILFLLFRSVIYIPLKIQKNIKK